VPAHRGRRRQFYYSIHFDQETSILFAFLERGEDHRMEAPARPTGDAPLVGIT
jgi:hypothetical protein